MKEVATITKHLKVTCQGSYKHHMHLKVTCEESYNQNMNLKVIC